MPSYAEAAESEVKEVIPVGVGRKIWIDLDNSPHVPFFRPIIDELEKRGFTILITARDAYQVRELLRLYEISCRIVGKHHGKAKIFKAAGTFWRAAQLTAIVHKEKPVLAISHGSRGCLLTSTLLGIPNITLADYEFVAKVPTVKPTWMMVPSVIPDGNLSLYAGRVMKYPGLKEDVYLSRFRPNPDLRRRLGIAQEEVLVVVRPPATEAHYHNPESEKLLTAALEKIVNAPGTRGLLLPRNKRQETELSSAWSASLASGALLIPENVEDGLNLVWNSDLVISGGGTMNREAAAMGVPVYSIFRGKIGAVDRYLANQGRMVLLETEEDVRTQVRLEHRRRAEHRTVSNNPALDTIVQNIADIVDTQLSGAKVRRA